MANSIAQKMRIKEGMKIHPLNPPSGYRKSLRTLPAKAKLVESEKDADQLHWFVLNRAEMEKGVDKMLKKLRPGVLLWIFYPKGTSKIQTDLTRDKGWEKLLQHDLQWISLISFDDTWSTFACRLKTDDDVKRLKAKPEVREIFKWVDPKTKTVKLPDDLTAMLKKNKKQNDYFQSLSFSCKKEYIEWIITAKRPETRDARLKGTMERLAKGWKNPSNQ